jgi:hypothetical protein
MDVFGYCDSLYSSCSFRFWSELLFIGLESNKAGQIFYLATILYAISFGKHPKMIGLLLGFPYYVRVTDRNTITNPKKIILSIVIILTAFSHDHDILLEE